MQLYKVAIDCGGTAQPYRAVLSLESLEGLKEASRDPALRAKTGEALVSALIERIPADLAIIERRHRHGHKLTDGSNGEPAYVTYFLRTGKPAEVRHMTDGALHDATDGTPAVVRYSGRKGRFDQVVSAERYEFGTHVKSLSRKERQDMEAERNAYVRGYPGRFAWNERPSEVKQQISQNLPGLKFL